MPGDLRQRYTICAVALGLVCLAGAAACQSQTDDPARPARIVSVDKPALMAVLENIVGRADISIVPEDLTGAETLSVPPPPLGEYETRSPAVPHQFRIFQSAENCFLRDEASGVDYPVGGLTCERVEE